MNKPIDALATRDINVKRNGDGLKLILGEKTERISMAEGERLMESLLKRLPHVPQGIDLAWENRYGAHGRTVRYYGVKDEEIVVTQYQSEILVNDQVVWRSGLVPSEAAAMIAAERWYGGPMVKWIDQIDRAGSRAQAKDVLVLVKAKKYAEEHGMTMDELWREVAQARREG